MTERLRIRITRRQELQAPMREHLQILPLTSRTALILHYLHDQTSEEIADILHAPIGMVKTHLFWVWALLKERLTGHSIARHARNGGGNATHGKRGSHAPI